MKNMMTTRGCLLLYTTWLGIWSLVLFTGAQCDTYLYIAPPTVRCCEGERCVVTCTFLTNATDLTQTTITWTWLNRTNGNVNSFMVHRRRPSSLTEGDGFKGRVSLKSGEKEASLIIDNSQISDSREYRCGVSVTSAGGGDKSDETHVNVTTCPTTTTTAATTTSPTTTPEQTTSVTSQSTQTPAQTTSTANLPSSLPPVQATTVTVTQKSTMSTVNTTTVTTASTTTTDQPGNSAASKLKECPDCYPVCSIVVYVLASLCIIAAVACLVIVSHKDSKFKDAVKECTTKCAENYVTVFFLVSVIVNFVFGAIAIIVTAVVTEQDKTDCSPLGIALLVVCAVLIIECVVVTVMYLKTKASPGSSVGPLCGGVVTETKHSSCPEKGEKNETKGGSEEKEKKNVSESPAHEEKNSINNYTGFHGNESPDRKQAPGMVHATSPRRLPPMPDNKLPPLETSPRKKKKKHKKGNTQDQ